MQCNTRGVNDSAPLQKPHHYDRRTVRPRRPPQPRVRRGSREVTDTGKSIRMKILLILPTTGIPRLFYFT